MKPQTLIMATANLESATEAVAAKMGDLNTQILIEEEKDIPDRELIKKLELEMEAIQDERNSLDSKDPAAVAALLAKYKPRKQRAPEESYGLSS